MLVRMVWWRKKLSADEKAAEIIAKYHAKKDRNSGIFTELPEKKRQDLGLHPTLRPEPKLVREEETKDPLTKRQRALLEELGLNPKEKKEKD
jgi:hypothetical protein